MNHRASETTHSGAWDPQGYAHNGNGYTQGATGYSSRAGQGRTQPGADPSYYPHQFVRREVVQYPYSDPDAGRASYVQNASSSMGMYPGQTSTYGFGVAHQSSAYTDAMPQHNPQSQSWPHVQQVQVTPRSQSMAQPQYPASPLDYSSPSLPLVASQMLPGVDTSFTSPSSWPRSYPPASGSSSTHQTSARQSNESGNEYSVPCPYGCGTVLTGVHAVGNMTRHLKSQNCVGSGKDKPKYACTVGGCDKRYIRSDGLKVHLRKRHGISQSSDGNGGSEYVEGGYGYS